MPALSKRDYDAVVVGSGPNGLAAAITMQQAGLSVLLVEGKKTVGGGMRSAELTLPGFVHDICSAIHPLAAGSPFFKTLPLDKFGLEYIYPPVAAAHPFESGTAAFLQSSLEDTAQALGADASAYQKLVRPVVKAWPRIGTDVLGSLRLPEHPIAMTKFGLNAMMSATALAKRFKTKEARGLWAGMAAHSMQPLTSLTTSGIAMVLLANAHLGGWPITKGGSNSIATALASYFLSIGGKIQTDFYVSSIRQLPSAHAILFDVTPKQLLTIAGQTFSKLYQWQLRRFRYGMGVFKIDWALDGEIPFKAESCKLASTIHLGNTLEEITASEQLTWDGKHPEQPFVLLSQPSVFDNTRAPSGKNTGWAYCHVPHGSTMDMTARIESQVERFAPGFRDRIIGRHIYNSVQLSEYNPNYIGGDIGGGVIDIGQIFTRPALRLSPYRTSAKGIYICSASTPPGGGVHGMCGANAAQQALKDVFRISVKKKL
jgi:phytoene dehydrogenase-like protein